MHVWFGTNSTGSLAWLRSGVWSLAVVAALFVAMTAACSSTSSVRIRLSESALEQKAQIAIANARAKRIFDQFWQDKELVSALNRYLKEVLLEAGRNYKTNPDAKVIAHAAVIRDRPETRRFLNLVRKRWRILLLADGFTATEVMELEDFGVSIAEQVAEDMAIQFVLDMRRELGARP